jgi:hypothetical protein
MEEIAQCINNNITTIVAILRQEEAKKVLLNRIFGSSISVQQIDDTYTCPKNLKKYGRWQKTVELSKAVISSEIPNTRLQKCPVNHLCTSRPAGREIDQTSMRKALKK